MNYRITEVSVYGKTEDPYLCDEVGGNIKASDLYYHSL
jgi:hypothetical protein